MDEPHRCDMYCGELRTFVDRVREAHFLCRCGNAINRQDQRVSQMSDRQTSLKRVVGKVLDAVPNTRLDVLCRRAHRQSMRAIAPTGVLRGVAFRLGLGREARDWRACKRTIQETLRAASPAWALDSYARSAVELHLAGLLVGAALVIAAGRHAQHVLVLLAADVALAGHLPVDVTTDGARELLLVY